MALKLAVFASFLASALAADGPYHALRIKPVNSFAPYELFPPIFEHSYSPEEKSYHTPTLPEGKPYYAPTSPEGKPYYAPTYPEGSTYYAPTIPEEKPYSAPTPYKFEYDVSNSHSHTESGSGGKVEGSYSVIEPDGQKRTVKYKADDKTGFEAEVSRTPASTYPIEKPYTAPTYSKAKPYSAPTEEEESNGAPASYNFQYKVADSHSHSESRIGDKVEGSYSVVEPDGQKRTVKYSADDKTGFKAEVSREPGEYLKPVEYKPDTRTSLPHLLPISKTLTLPNPLESIYPLPSVDPYSYIPIQYNYPHAYSHVPLHPAPAPFLGPALLPPPSPFPHTDLYSKPIIPFK